MQTPASPPEYLTFPILFAAIGVTIGVGAAFFWVRSRLSQNDGAARTMALIAPLFLAGWLAVVLGLALAGAFEARDGGPTVPIITYGLAAPILFLSPLVLYSGAFGRILDLVPQSALVAFQTYRVLGIVFLILYAQGLTPTVFAFPAGIRDTLVGVSAVAVVALLRLRRPGAGRYVALWNGFGIANLALAGTLGFLSSPGRFNVLSSDAPNFLITAYPLVLIPVFVVPLSILLHLSSLRKLRQAAREERDLPPLAAAG